MMMEQREEETTETGRAGRAEKRAVELPQGPLRMRLLGTVYDAVFKTQLEELLDRGLLVGAEFWRDPGWVPLADHPDFEELQAAMSAEAKAVMRGSGEPNVSRRPDELPADGSEFDEVTQPNVSMRLVAASESETTASSSSTSDVPEETKATLEVDSETLSSMSEASSPEELDAIVAEAEVLRAPMDESVVVESDSSQLDSGEVRGLFDDERQQTPSRVSVHTSVVRRPTPDTAETKLTRTLMILAIVVLSAIAAFLVGWLILSGGDPSFGFLTSQI